MEPNETATGGQELLIDYKDVEVLRKELVVLKHVDLTVSPGEMVYLIGKVGSGKSSLMKTFYGEVPVAEGEALVLGNDMTRIQRREIPYLRRRMGIVFQDFQLLTDRSVAENLLFVMRAIGWTDKHQMQTRMDEVLAEVGMSSRTYKMPHELSGGEQQRIAIARALINRPAIILADEPTGNLDPETAEQIIGRMHAIAMGGTSVVMATHNLQFVERFPGTVYRCENKKLTRL